MMEAEEVSKAGPAHDCLMITSTSLTKAVTASPIVAESKDIGKHLVREPGSKRVMAVESKAPVIKSPPDS